MATPNINVQPLHDRIEFISHGGLVNPRQAQLELRPFDKDRLKEVALKLREMFPAKDRAKLEAKITPQYIEALVTKVTEGFKGDVGVVPRQFLRQLVDVLDLASEHEDFDPSAELGFAPKNPTEDELRKMKGQPPYDAEPDDDKGYPTINW